MVREGRGGVEGDRRPDLRRVTPDGMAAKPASPRVCARWAGRAWLPLLKAQPPG